MKPRPKNVKKLQKSRTQTSLCTLHSRVFERTNEPSLNEIEGNIAAIRQNYDWYDAIIFLG